MSTQTRQNVRYSASTGSFRAVTSGNRWCRAFISKRAGDPWVHPLSDCELFNGARFIGHPCCCCKAGTRVADCLGGWFHRWLWPLCGPMLSPTSCTRCQSAERNAYRLVSVARGRPDHGVLCGWGERCAPDRVLGLGCAGELGSGCASRPGMPKDRCSQRSSDILARHTVCGP